MFNKNKCKRCEYHAKYTGSSLLKKNTSKGSEECVMCNYASMTFDTCLKYIDGKVVDTRGEDMNNCLLFKKDRSSK